MPRKGRTVSLRGTDFHLANAGKRHVAVSMFRKGHGFVGAAILLRQEKERRGVRDEGFEWVVLHLLCQGIEVALKGLLLLRDYDRYRPRLKPLGHNIYKIAEETLAAFGLRELRPGLAAELKQLSALYSRHLLRYGGGYDLLVNPRTIARDRVFRRLVACFHLAQRELGKGLSS
jgi:hypothetical protein